MDEIEYILNLPELVEDFNIENIKLALDKLNYNPKVKFIHIAGTNGKGSTCAMINQTLIEAGYNTGFYSSPHLLKINERIKINNQNISDNNLNNLIQKLRETGIKLTFFEYLTAAALLHFQDLDYAVIETGLGGRLDATNIINPIITIITNISIDHIKHLGNTIELIAKEKAGIIKPNIPLITLAKEPALSIIKNKCIEKNTELIIPEIKDLELSLKGNFQKENASIAYKTLTMIGIKENIIKNAFKNTYWPGRFEKIDNIILDCAHNLAGITALTDELKEKDITLIFGIMKDKDISHICEKLSFAKNVIIVKPKNKRSAEPKEIAHYFNNPIIIPEIKDAIKKAKEFELPILITGSIFTVADALPIIKKSTMPWSKTTNQHDYLRIKDS